MVRFWSLSRCGLSPVSGRGSLRVLCAAVRVCGLPRPFVRRTSNRRDGWWEAGLDFWGPVRGAATGALLFRCCLSVRVSPVRPRW